MASVLPIDTVSAGFGWGGAFYFLDALEAVGITCPEMATARAWLKAQ